MFVSCDWETKQLSMCKIQNAKRSWSLFRMACYAKGENQNKPCGLEVVSAQTNQKKKKERPCGLVRVCSAQAKEERKVVWAWGVLGPKWRGVGDS